MRHSQLSFINKVPDQAVQFQSQWKLYIDGAARNNPGPAGAGIYLCKDSSVIASHGFFLGSKTNNQAEYLALLLGIFYFRRHVSSGDRIHIISDSKLLVNQMMGNYRVKNDVLLRMQHIAFALLKDHVYFFSHVMRELNKHADKLANLGIDRQLYPPTQFIQLLQEHGITF